MFGWCFYLWPGKETVWCLFQPELLFVIYQGAVGVAAYLCTCWLKAAQMNRFVVDFCVCKNCHENSTGLDIVKNKLSHSEQKRKSL